MSFQITLTYSESLLRLAVLAFWRRTVGIGFVFALVALSLGLSVLVLQGAVSWLIGVLATILVLGISFVVALYVVHYRNSLRKFREMGTPQAMFLAQEDSFTISSSLGSSTLNWAVVKEVWRFPDVWLLLYSKAQFTTLPVACLSSEMQAFVLHRVQESGGKIDA